MSKRVKDFLLWATIIGICLLGTFIDFLGGWVTGIATIAIIAVIAAGSR